MLGVVSQHGFVSNGVQFEQLGFLVIFKLIFTLFSKRITTTLNINRDLEISFYKHQRFVTTQTIFGIFNNGSVTFQNGGWGMSNWKEVKILNLFVGHAFNGNIVRIILQSSRLSCVSHQQNQNRAQHPNGNGALSMSWPAWLGQVSQFPYFT